MGDVSTVIPTGSSSQSLELAQRFATALINLTVSNWNTALYCLFTGDNEGVFMNRFVELRLGIVLLISFALCGCQNMVTHDTQSLLLPRFYKSEVFGFIAGLGTTFAAVPDLLAMLRRRSTAGMNPRMAAIMGAFQVLWVYYGLLILSRPVIVWNVIAILINFLSVGAYFHFAKSEKTYPATTRGR